MSQQHVAKFMGKVGKVRYKFENLGFTFYGFVMEYLDDVEWKSIEEVYLDNPPLNIGDEILVASLQKTVMISKVIRSTDNSYVYYTNHVIERIEDEETLESKESAEQEKKDCEERQNKLIEEQPKKKWYQFWR